MPSLDQLEAGQLFSSTSPGLVPSPGQLTTATASRYLREDATWQAPAGGFSSTTPFVATGATASISAADRAAYVVNVKDFGAKGDGVTDDTASIQNALNSAYGAPNSPNGVANRFSNKEVYFPPGNYVVNSPTAIGVTGAVNDGTGKIKLTLASALNARVVTGCVVYVTAVGGVTNANGNFGIVVNDSTHITLNSSTFAGSYTSGGSVAFPALNIAAVYGAHIYGAGRLATQIRNSNGSGASVFAANGLAYSRIERLIFDCGGASAGNVCFDWNWDNVQNPGSQGTTFQDCYFQGAAIGLWIGSGGFQTSEGSILNCHFVGLTTAGVEVKNFNALGHTMVGGNCASCAIGVHVGSGAVTVIHGVHFQNQTDADIAVDNTVGDNYSIHGCRSEGGAAGTYFARLHAGSAANISCCTQVGSGGHFVFIESGGGTWPGSVSLLNNYSANGDIAQFSNGEIYMQGNFFGNSSYLANFNTATAVVHSVDNVGKNPTTVANLPAAAACYKGVRMTVTDSTVAGSGNFGATVAGTGTNTVPVYCDGTNWKIG